MFFPVFSTAVEPPQPTVEAESESQGTKVMFPREGRVYEVFLHLR